MHKIFLYPEEFYISNEPSRVITLLGSCVAVTVYSRKLKIGGICHGLLPAMPREGHCGSLKCRMSDKNRRACKYVDHSIRILLRELDKNKVPFNDIEVKVFGGSELLQSGIGSGTINIGRVNIEAALETLSSANITPMAVETGGKTGRKIVFFTHTGEVFVKNIKSIINHHVTQNA